jgi:uncharacterized protein involved in response to NO
MLTILLYVLAYIGAAYTLMAVPCYIWYSRGRLFSMERERAAAFFVTAPITWPLFAFGATIDGCIWLRDRVLKLIGRK